MDIISPASALNNVDLPTLGLPTIATTGLLIHLSPYLFFMFNRIQNCRNKIGTCRIHNYDFFSDLLRKFGYCHIIQEHIFPTPKHIAWNQKPVSQFLSGKLFYKILSGNKSGNRDLFSKEMIPDFLSCREITLR